MGSDSFTGLISQTANNYTKHERLNGENIVTYADFWSIKSFRARQQPPDYKDF